MNEKARRQFFFTLFCQNTNKRKSRYLGEVFELDVRVKNYSPHSFFNTRAKAHMFKKRGIIIIPLPQVHVYGAKGMAKITQTAHRHSTNNESAIYEF